MKNLGIIFAIVIALFSAAISTANETIVTLGAEDSNFEVVNKSETSLGIVLSLSDITFSEERTTEGIFSRILVPGFSKDHSQAGKPELPVMSRLIEIPYGAEININITSYDEELVSLSANNVSQQLLPVQPSWSKSADPESIVFIQDKLAYNINSFNQGESVRIEYMGTMRGVRIARLTISPFRYNPVTRTLKVLNNLVAEINFRNANLNQTKQIKEKYYSPLFQNSFNSLLNYKPSGSKDSLMKYPVKYVIVADPMFQSALQPFIHWKTKKGFKVIEAYTNNPSVGNTTASIQSYLTSLYHSGTSTDPAPSYVLFVGDVAQIPGFTGLSGPHVTDLYYCEYDGNGDYIPDVYYGRFSANNLTQLQPQLSKTLEYEQYLMTTTAYLDEVVMVAGVDGSYAATHGNGQINYGTANYFNTSHGLTSNTYLYPASGSSASQIIADVSGGVGFANYTAHCGSGGWSDPSFSISDIATLQNDGQYPLMIGNCCHSNAFDGTCFGEELLRASGKGALGYIGGSNSTLWDEDFYWSVGFGTPAANPTYAGTGLGAYDRLYHENGEPRSEWYESNGQIMFAGNLAVTQANTSNVLYYWEIYHLMGDPSLMTYFGTPPAMTVSYQSLLPLGGTSIIVNCEPDAYVAISKDSILYGAALADTSGVAVVNLNPITTPGNANVVITGMNFQPYMGTLLVASPAGPYVALNNHQLNDNTGNNNGKADYGETVTLDIALENFGNTDASMVTSVISSTDTNIMITDSTEMWNTVISHDTNAKTNVFAFSVNQYIPDQHIVNFALKMSDSSGNTWNSPLSLKLNAPKPMIFDFEIDDSNGNGDGTIDPGETLDIKIINANAGHCDALNSISTLSCFSPLVTINTATVNLNTLQAQQQVVAVFNITVSSSAQPGNVFELHNNLTSGLYSANKSFAPMVGLMVEDWETGDFTNFNWMNQGNQNWTIIAQNAYEGTYCALSGAIGNSEVSRLSVDMSTLSNDSISFFRKVSSELDYDFLQFSIDGNIIDQWSGTANWARVSYPVAAGQHTFEWSYTKDFWVSDGSDCGWIDFITFPVAAGVTTAIEQKGLFTDDFNVYPNPFSNNTNFSVSLAETREVQIRVFDALGREVAVVFDGILEMGQHEVAFNANELPEGVYFGILTLENDKITRKLIVTRR